MGGVNIPLPELDTTRPAPNPAPNALEEFQRAASLQTAAAQQDAIMAQTQGQTQQNQQQALVLKDEQLYRDLAPQHTIKDANGKVTGMDFDGLYTDMQGHGANVLPFQSKQIELQKQILGLAKDKRDQLSAMHSDFQDALETVQGVYKKESQSNPPAVSAAPTAAPPATPAAPAPGATPPEWDVSKFPLKTTSAPAAPLALIGRAPAGTPESLGTAPTGTAPTQTEGALQSAAENAPRPVGPLTQQTYQRKLVELAQKWGPQAIGQFQPMLHDGREIEQAEAGQGSLKEALANADKQADIAEKAGKGAQGQAAAAKDEWIGSDGIFANIKTGQVIHAGGSPSLQAFQEYVSRGGDPLNFAANQAAQSARATLPVDVAKAAQIAQATAGTDVSKAVATELEKQKALAPSLQQITNTTRAGRTYINRDEIPSGSAGVTEQQALKAGIPVVNKDTASTLEDIDTAKANQDYMLNQISGKLASDATGRLYKAPENTIEKLAQSDPTLAAVGTYRNAAIQSMRAVAGSKGLRINQYEVQLAIDNDIPKMTDTLPVAQQKLTNLKAFLDNTEQAHLTRNRGPNAPPAPNAPPKQKDFFQQFGGQARQ